MINIKNLWKSFGTTAVLKGLNLEIQASRTTIILGQSGAGKSVLLKHIAGLEIADKGSIFINGELLCPNRHSKDVGMLFQHSALFDSMSIEENVAFSLVHQRRLQIYDPVVQEAVSLALESVGLSGYQKKFPSELSGGQKRRAALARLLVYKPKILLFDEPTTGLDPVTARNIANLIKSTQEKLHATVVVVTHDVVSAMHIGDYFALHQDGVIAHEGEQNTFFSNPEVNAFVQSAFLPQIGVPQ